MKLQEYKARTAELGLEWPMVKAIYDEMRAQERAAIERTLEIRKTAFAFLGYENGGQLKRRGAFRGGDADDIRGFDCVAKELAQPELIPELGSADPAGALWELITADAPELPPADETMARAIERAILEKPADKVSPDDLLPLPEAAHAADITQQWLRQLVKAGRVKAIRVGRCWLVVRRSAEQFKRHPTAGRPRREAAPF